jgi:hypothetical protein
MIVQLHATSGLPQEKSLWQTLDKRLPEAQNRSEFCWLELNCIFFVIKWNRQYSDRANATPEHVNIIGRYEKHENKFKFYGILNITNQQMHIYV